MKAWRATLLLAAAVVAAIAQPGTVFTATGLDAGAGNWRMIALTGPTQIAVAAPGQVTALDYQAELTAIKNAQAALTAEQRKAIEYWSSGGVLRWNEILLGLVSRFNLPPAPAPDNSYPVPDANNPFADPNFPFANPPYASRAYSYVTVAQYDALKAAWYYKFLYNRPAPSKVDSAVKRLGPASDLPAYPSEDAVLSGVTAELLKLLFPAAVEEITLKAAEQRQAALLSGEASASDIAAGLALGQAVAAVFVARAGADGMRTAGGSPALWAGWPPAPRPVARSPGRVRTARPAADAAVLRQRPRLDDDGRRHRARAAGSAAADGVRADGARGGRGPALRGQGHPPRTGDRELLGGRSEHADAAGPLELHRGALHPQGRVQRGACRAGVRAAEQARCTTLPSAAGT